MLGLANKRIIKKILASYNIHPRKGLGQHFLISRSALHKILGAADLTGEDVIVEIGPGLGALTIALAPHVEKIIAIEKDRQLVAILKNNLILEKIGNVSVVEEDALREIRNQKSEIRKLKMYKVVANLPYNIASRMVRLFLETKKQPEFMLVTVQKEVGERMCARPPNMSLLALAVQFYANVTKIIVVPKQAFWPRPEVDGMLLKIVPRRPPEHCPPPELFFKTARTGFAHPRKLLFSNLLKNKGLPRATLKRAFAMCAVSEKARASELSISSWCCLADFIHTQ